ncbi:Hint domain-containing protein [Yoonia maritima]|uniref:Hint domain-containing protein n=1 Tax=Yoonia maritima TaxID=1435347 RepID=A0A2T0VUA9_9RHOB|nr:Hint domain-containing protein [Yoonia maritima]PRY75035.1 Hint domain-containing protein [Yoonia maritima]
MFWAFQGTRDGNAITPTNYVAVIGNEADGSNTQTPNLTGTGLTTSNGAVIIDGDEDYMEWTADGTLPIQQEDLIASILDLDNWTTADGTGVQNTGGGFNVETQNIVCFARGTKISSCEGAIEIEKLRVGQKIVTLAAGAAKIRWIGVIKLSRADLAANPKLRPVRIRAGALGKELPKQDLLVSRQHRILFSSKVAERMFGLRDVLIPAVRLTNLPDIFIDETIDSISYYHILCDDHQVVFAEGAPAETLFLGKEAAHSLSIDAQEEIETLFPGLVGQQCPTSAAQMIVDLPRQNRLIARHIKNNKPLLETYRN